VHGSQAARRFPKGPTVRRIARRVTVQFLRGFSVCAREIRQSAASQVSALRPVLAWSLLAVGGRLTNSIDARLLLAAGVTAVGVLDVLDGAIARRQPGNSSRIGGAIDIVADRLSDFAVWLFIAPTEPGWRIPILVVILRDVIVDTTKVVSSVLGHHLDHGVLVSGRRRRTLVLSRASKAPYRVCTGVVFVIGLIEPAWPKSSFHSAGFYLVVVAAAMSVARGLPSVLEVRRTFAIGRRNGPDELFAVYTAQAIAGAATAVLIWTGMRIFRT
jgi:phosphatidylglycerophosphate synthase